jgi:NAD(P)-dependent dehydrogenase (short-subunit alcohol dehydrogenase family)
MNVLVTGASRGMGLEFVRQYLERGERVFAGCRNPLRSAGLNTLKAAHPDELTLLTLDVADADSLRRARALIEGKIRSLDLLINNAGVFSLRQDAQADPGDTQTLGRLNAEEALTFFRINATGAVLAAQEFAGLLKTGKNPKIASLSSGYGSIGSNTGGFPYHYSASKAALNMYMRSCAADLKGSGIAVVILDPGWVRTEMGGPQASLAPEESVAGMINVIDKLSLAQTGSFLTWQGNEETW